MKKPLLILLTVLSGGLLPSCESVPVTVSYTGTAAGHGFTAGYSGTSGAILAVHQK